MIATASIPDSILAKLSGVKPCSDGVMALCPGHADRNPSLHVSTGNDGRILLKCHAGCTTQSIVAAMGMTLKDLFRPRDSSNGNGHRPHDPKPARPKPTFITAQAAIRQAAAWAKVPSHWRPALFDYPKHGKEFAKMARWDDPDGSDKTCRPVHQTANGWSVGDPFEQWPPYTEGHDLPATGLICGAEGEPCCNLFWSIGLPCFSTAHGASISAAKLDCQPFLFNAANGTLDLVPATLRPHNRADRLTVTIPPEQRDPKLLDKLQTEWPGILAWAVRGFQDWRRNGMQTPEEVIEATDGYKADQDVLSDYLAARCVVMPDSKVTRAELLSDYQSYCVQHQEKHPLDRSAFYTRILSLQGVTEGQWRPAGSETPARGFKGIGLSFVAACNSQNQSFSNARA